MDVICTNERATSTETPKRRLRSKSGFKETQEIQQHQHLQQQHNQQQIVQQHQLQQHHQQQLQQLQHQQLQHNLHDQQMQMQQQHMLQYQQQVNLNILPEKTKKAESRKLKKKLQEIAEANDSLTKAIHEKNDEISELRRSVRSLNDVLNSVPIDELRCNSSIASTKILELSKKNRQLRAEVETTKNRINQRENQIKKLERDLKTALEKVPDEELSKKESANSVSEMQSKVNSIQQKLFEARNRNVELQNQLKLAQKCIQNEIGENFNLNQLAAQTHPSTWRGRAQQILHLQQKIQEMKDRLEMYECSGTGRVSSCSTSLDTNVQLANDSNANGGNNSGTLVQITVENAPFDRFTPGVRKSEILHRAKVDALENEISGLNKRIDDQKAKILALKVRNKTLNDDMIKFKVKANALEEQTDFNGINLTTMTERLNTQKYQYESQIENLKREINMMIKQRDDAEFKENQLNSKIEDLNDVVVAKIELIEEYKLTNKKLEDDLKAVCGEFLFSCRELRKEEFIAILDALEFEKNQLMEQTKILTDRYNKECSKTETLSEQLHKSKVRLSRSEAKIRELEKELETVNERKKRSQRIADYANSLTSINNSVDSFVFENSSSVTTMSINGLVFNEEISQSHLTDLRNQLEFANEKIQYLEEKVTYLKDEKDADAKMFADTINNSKNIILDTILTQKTARSDNTENCQEEEDLENM